VVVDEDEVGEGARSALEGLGIRVVATGRRIEDALRELGLVS